MEKVMARKKELFSLICRMHKSILGHYKYSIWVFFMLISSSCATLTENPDGNVFVQVKDSITGEEIKNAQCSIINKEKLIAKQVPPFELKLNSRHLGYIVSCNAKGYKSTQKPIPRIQTKGFDKGLRNSVTFVGGLVDIISNSDKKYVTVLTIIMEKLDNV
jgi:hypothetical protein